MEKLLNEFTVARPVDETWKVLTDLERIAPCMPGAELTEIEGDVYRGVVKVKLGAISTNFKGQASFVERDDVHHSATLKAEGRDTGGRGNANATINAVLTPVTDSSTTCRVETELHISGKVAQFGRGIMADVSKKLIGQFADNLNAMISASPTADTAAAEAVAAEAPAESPAATSTTADNAAETPAETPAENEPTAGAAPRAVRTVNGPAAEPIDMTEIAGSAVLKRLLPLLGGLVVLVLAWRRLRR
jgi:carbon monoxide dehydrogenase subunit G